MPSFSKVSEGRLVTCHPDLQRVMREAIKWIDFSVVCGYRGKEEQDDAYEKGFSKLRFPQSRHNTSPSEAIDVIPYPTGYSDTKEFYRLAGVIDTVAQQLGVEIRWGGTWKTFVDLPHWELA